MITQREFIGLADYAKAASAAAIVEETYNQDPMSSITQADVHEAYAAAAVALQFVTDALHTESVVINSYRGQIPAIAGTKFEGER